MRFAPLLAISLAAGVVRADPPDHLVPQAQADLGLSVVYAAYEWPLADHLALEVGGGIFGSYFLPWFDSGQDVKGIGVGVRPTWFANTSGHGLYVAPYFRFVGVSGDSGGDSGHGTGYTAGAFAGWALPLTDKLDLRLGAGVQYIRFHVDLATSRLETSTPFIGLDCVLGYRL